MTHKPGPSIYHEWHRRDGEVTRLIRQQFKGHDLPHLRNFYRDQHGNLKPTSKGVTIPDEQIAPLREGLRRAQKTVVGSADDAGSAERPKTTAWWANE